MKLKRILALSAVAIMLGALTVAISTVVAESQAVETDDIGDIPEQLSDGETVVMAENESKPYKEMDYNTDIVSLEDWENTDIGEYPLDANSAEWSQLSSIETAAACNMPKEYAESLTTEELVDYAVNYPFLMDILAFDHIADGIDHLAKKSYLFEELFSRADCCEELLNEYLNMEINYAELAESYDVCETNYDSEIFIEVYMGLNYDLLSENQAARFVEEYGNKVSNINSVFQESLFSTLFYGTIKERKTT